MGGPRLVLGDAVAWIDTRADLVLGGVSDPGRVTQVNSSPYQMIGAADPVVGGGNGWFTLWTPSTAINLFSAGGNLTPMTVSNSRFLGEELSSDVTRVSADGRRYFVYPSIVRAVAAGGNIVLADNAAGYDNPVLLLAPSAGGQLEMLAGRSILANGAHAVSMSAADAPLPTPWRPAFSAFEVSNGNPILTNTSKDGVQPGSLGYNKPLFVFGPASPTNRALHAGDDTVARFYAVTGDILGLKSGAVVDMSNTGRSTDTWYEAAVPVSVRAGRDIMRLDVTALHNNARDLSLIEAGRDIIYANAQVAGPGTLLMQAARQVRQDDAASVRSLGAIVRGDNRLGADIAVLAGVGAAGPDYAGLLARYLDPTRALAAGETLGANPDRVVRSYGGEMTLANWLRLHFGYQGDEQGRAGRAGAAAGEGGRPGRRRRLAQAPRSVAGLSPGSELHLVNWLRKQHGYEGGQDGAAAAFAALAPAERGIYARQLFFAELKEGGREYNEEGGPRFGSYLRGRRAIAALFPESDAAGGPIRYEGSFTMYGGAGLRSSFGGNIQLLTPGGQQVLGVEGVAPPASAGVVTQGQGNIQLYAQGSVLLGQSRIMTTFGGHIQAWSANGDINAGRGATTVLYTPPRRVYDAFGNVTLSPTVPSTGAGIGTLAPIPEVPAGDVDLIAPLGTIDAGEAGIRVSGNVNIAALHVVNAANIQVQGESKHPGDGLGQHRRPVQRQRGGLHGHGGGAGRDAARPRRLAPESAIDYLGADPGLWRRAAAGRPRAGQPQRRRRQAGADLSGRQRVPDGRRRSADAGAAGRADAGRAAQLAAVTMAAITEARPAEIRAGAAGAGEPTALQRFIASHYDDLRCRLVAYLGSEDLAGDSLHDVWLRLATSQAAEVRNPGAYVFRMACNLAVDGLRQGWREVGQDGDDAGLLADDAPGPAQVARRARSCCPACAPCRPCPAAARHPAGPQRGRPVAARSGAALRHHRGLRHGRGAARAPDAGRRRRCGQARGPASLVACRRRTSAAQPSCSWFVMKSGAGQAPRRTARPRADGRSRAMARRARRNRCRRNTRRSCPRVAHVAEVVGAQHVAADARPRHGPPRSSVPCPGPRHPARPRTSWCGAGPGRRTWPARSGDGRCHAGCAERRSRRRTCPTRAGRARPHRSAWPAPHRR